MVDAIAKEIRTHNQTGGTINTIYFGGGTPSLLTGKEINNLLETIHTKFYVFEDAEITLEANPDDINSEALQVWKKSGINRLSVGIQSFQEKELIWMNRAHDASDSMNCIKDIKESGFENFSVDLIYGSPLQNVEDLKKNVETIFSFDVPHVSCYALTVEPKTALDKLIRQKKSDPVDDEKQSDHFMLLMNWMRAAGYEHYEISNFAKPGMQSRHNSSYWSGIPYFGFGPSAHSFDGMNKRKWNAANNALYLQALQQGEVLADEEILTATQTLNEYIMISLRTSNGIDLKNVEERFGIAIKTRLVDSSLRHIEHGTVVYENGILLLSDKGKTFADGIAADLFISD